jgi:hypothetical protein
MPSRTRTIESGASKPLPYTADVGVIGLVPDVWRRFCQPRQYVLKRLAQYFNVVWRNPGRRWYRLSRRRAHALLLVAEGQPFVHAAHLFQTAPPRIRTWPTQFLACGWAGLLDAPRSGRPPSSVLPLWAFLEEAISRSPQDYRGLSTVRSVRHLSVLLTHKYGPQDGAATVYQFTYEVGRYWCRQCGQADSNQLRHPAH